MLLLLTFLLGSIKDEDSQYLWNFLLARNQLSMLLSWLSSASSNNTNKGFPELPEVMLTVDDRVPTYTKERLLNALVQQGFYPQFLLSDMRLLSKYLCQNNLLFTDRHPMENYMRGVTSDERKRLTMEFNKQFLCFCEENDLVVLLWKFVSHYK